MNRIHRYPGVKPFSSDERNLFFGREEDSEKLCKLINVEQLVVLYAKSGLGKSSLLHAGVMPKLQQQAGVRTFYLRFGNYSGSNSPRPIETLARKLREQAPDQRLTEQLLPEDQSPWALLKNQQATWRREEATFVVVIDQFEELFTYPDEQVDEVKERLAELLNVKVPQRFREQVKQQFKAAEQQSTLSEEDRHWLFEPLNTKLVLAIRADKFSLLDRLSDYLPNILSKTYKLAPLTWRQAEDAILNPAYSSGSQFVSPPFDFQEEALTLMLNFLTNRKQKPIESFQLQILCRHIESLVIEKQKRIIEANDLLNLADVYQNYYDHQLKRIGGDDEQRIAHLMIEEGLVFEEDQVRVSMYERQLISRFGASPQLLQKLIDTHLLRAEPNADGAMYYELSHDSLIAPVLKAKHLRREREMQERRLLLQRRFFRRRAVVAVGVMCVLLGVLGVYAWKKSDEVLQALQLVRKKEAEKKAGIDSAAQYLNKQNTLAVDSLTTALSRLDQRSDSLRRALQQQQQIRNQLLGNLEQLKNRQASRFIAAAEPVTNRNEQIELLRKQLRQANEHTRQLLRTYAADQTTYERLYKEVLLPYEQLEQSIR
jgi:hypothetical protein